MESVLPSANESGLGKVDNSAIFVGVIRCKSVEKKTTKQGH